GGRGSPPARCCTERDGRSAAVPLATANLEDPAVHRSDQLLGSRQRPYVHARQDRERAGGSILPVPLLALRSACRRNLAQHIEAPIVYAVLLLLPLFSLLPALPMVALVAVAHRGNEVIHRITV